MKLYTYLALSICLLASCNQTKPQSQAKKNVLRLNFQQEPTTLDQRRAGDFTTSSLFFLIGEGLTRSTPNGIAELALAKSVDIADDLMTYTFHLRESNWADGTPVTASDFVDAWLEMLDPDFPSPNAQLMLPIKNADAAKKGLVPLSDVGIKRIDDLTIEVQLGTPTPYLLELIAFSCFYPVNFKAAKENPSWAESYQSPIPSNGPYKIVKWKSTDEFVLAKNENYWKKDKVSLDEIKISLIQNEMTAFQLYQQGELDFIGLPYTNIPPDCLPDLAKEGTLRTCSPPSATICTFNTEQFPFNNKHIRKAFALAINRSEILSNVAHVHDAAQTDIIPENMKMGRKQNFYLDGEVQKAKEELSIGLKELGITEKDLPVFQMIHASIGMYPKVAQALQQQWRNALNVKVDLVGLEYGVFMNRLVKRDYQMGQCIWIAHYHDPMNILERFKMKDNAKNYPGFYNAEYEALLEESQSVKDPSKRFSLLARAEEILLDEAPVTCIYHWKNPYLCKSYVSNLQESKDGTFYFNDVVINTGEKCS